MLGKEEVTSGYCDRRDVFRLVTIPRQEGSTRVANSRIISVAVASVVARINSVYVDEICIAGRWTFRHNINSLRSECVGLVNSSLEWW